MKDNAISKVYRKKIEKSRKEEQEYGAGKKDFAVCQTCNAVYYSKSWHQGFLEYKHLNEDKSIRFVICPACRMIKDGKFEGKVVLENVPSEYKDEILNNVKNTGDRASKRDPMDRIVEIKESGNDIEVLTTENQLARVIGRQVARAYKNAKTSIQWSKEESVARVLVRFTE